ncbi:MULTISPECIES: hypothetical protein [Desulfococcus]|jgi:hypothetical protein|uniref:Uncharacterized protein n=1 Tax=Desulfococcus multivorans DSM 2059 TaxID=1121405 RepID=S7VD48_DESML|nr:hypothetical protein [Desulfococcus multivorans]AOY59318.1 conserved uncharacterized protein [Desulfococcus multivorans]AQV01537.1 hypothetical protein B2D07_12745 [Desulfococcus multivorans]EPR42383.1 hypothetical protein dsmv_1657 [Desulfococcus multivorans DSM 2059]SKA14510.1 hypothetical protein SAMN02745446_02961 [Desulfococcus multivorans DSM 2059]
MEQHYETSEFRSWVIITLILAFILTKGVFAFVMVGDRGQPDWAYRAVRDVPGESPYAVYEKLPNPQHVRGSEGE